MRNYYVICITLVIFSLYAPSGVGYGAETPTEGKQTKARGTEETSLAKSTKSFAPLGAPKKSEAAPLGKPKFALKNSSPMAGGAGANAPDRAAEVKRLIGAYDNLAIQYYYMLTVAKTPEEKEAIIAKHEPSENIVRSFARLLSHIVAVDPKDEPALDALLFLNRYVGLPEVDKILAGTPVESGEYSASQLEPVALMLEFHADNPKLAGLLKTLPPGEATYTFLQALFAKSHDPEVRAASGIRLVMALQQSDRSEEAEQIALMMSEDRYLDGVPITARPNGPTARGWAEGKLRELRLLAIGQVLPEVSGEILAGGTGQITDYRGKVVVLDVWTTWCGPCAAMIPHEIEMTERLKDKPFALLSVSCDADKETLVKYLEGTPMPWDHWWVGMDSEFSKTLNINAFPTIIVLDAQGVIRYKNLKDEELEEAVNGLLAEIEEPTSSAQN